MVSHVPSLDRKNLTLRNGTVNKQRAELMLAGQQRLGHLFLEAGPGSRFTSFLGSVETALASGKAPQVRWSLRVEKKKGMATVFLKPRCNPELLPHMAPLVAPASKRRKKF